MAENRLLVDVLHNIPGLVCVYSGCQNVAGVVIDERADVALLHMAIFPNRQIDVFNVRLSQHHPVWSTEASAGSLPCLHRLLHMVFAESSLVKMLL